MVEQRELVLGLASQSPCLHIESVLFHLIFILGDPPNATAPGLHTHNNIMMRWESGVLAEYCEEGSLWQSVHFFQLCFKVLWLLLTIIIDDI